MQLHQWMILTRLEAKGQLCLVNYRNKTAMHINWKKIVHKQNNIDKFVSSLQVRRKRKAIHVFCVSWAIKSLSIVCKTQMCLYVSGSDKNLIILLRHLQMMEKCADFVKIYIWHSISFWSLFADRTGNLLLSINLGASLVVPANSVF